MAMSRGVRLGLIGTATFIVCLVAFAPASLVRPLLPVSGPVTLTAPAGTLWHGSADLGLAGTPLGRVVWSFAPSTLLRAQLGFDLELTGAHAQLRGRAATSARAAHANVAGTIDVALLGGILTRYDLHIPGNLTVEHLDITAPYTQKLPDVHGDLKWSGGDVAYRLSGRDHRVTLPPLVGFVDSSAGQPGLTAYEVDDKTPLLLAHLAQDGMATIGITKQFTKLIGDPWPGGEPDHAVVLEVGEKLF